MVFKNKILNIYKSIAYTRCDDTGTAFYFSADDFSGLKKESFSFDASLGYILQGYLYYYEAPLSERIVVFDHGFGGGHRSYMKEIEMLCKHGYQVFAYDHSGCMESGGECTNGMAQSLCDLNDCISFLKSNERFSKLDISVIGHSWGGYSTLNICALHPDISHIVAISGFVSVELLINSYFNGVLKLYRKDVLELERNSNPKFVDFNAVESLSKTNAKILLIYSDNDKMCKKSPHYDLLYKSLSNKSNVKFVLESNKEHNPNYTSDAVQYLREYLAAKKNYAKANKLVTPERKSEFLKSFDWNKMTAQDESVWAKIFECLDS